MIRWCLPLQKHSTPTYYLLLHLDRTWAARNLYPRIHLCIGTVHLHTNLFLDMRLIRRTDTAECCTPDYSMALNFEYNQFQLLACHFRRRTKPAEIGSHHHRMRNIHSMVRLSMNTLHKELYCILPPRVLYPYLNKCGCHRRRTVRPSQTHLFHMFHCRFAMAHTSSMVHHMKHYKDMAKTTLRTRLTMM